MKKLFSVIIFCMPLIVFAQNVAINNDASEPDNSAILDIKSKSKGILMPRLTSAERIAIALPAIGLTVFDTNTLSYWMFRGDLYNGWVEIQHSQQNLWTATGPDIYNTSLGNVGIGTNTPGSKLSINGTDPVIGLLNNGLATGSIEANGFDMKIATHPDNPIGDIVFQPRGIDRMWIDQSGNVGIGTATPASLLTINGTNPSVKMLNAGIEKGYLQALGNNLVLGTSLANTGNLTFATKLNTRMTIDDIGQVGIGTVSPSSLLTLNATDPILQMRNANVDKGFIQLVDDDIKIGTNASNDQGKFIVRTNGADRFTVDNIGNASLGGDAMGGLLTFDGNYTGVILKTGAVGRLSMIAAGVNPEITGSGSGIFRIRNSNDGMYLYPNGKISIGGGGATAQGFVVSVEGKLIATDLTALDPAGWPDYVFADDYKLKSLAEVKKFIAENNHLPGIPPAAEIEKNGVQLGDMSRRLMEKVEELTLYILQQQDQIDELKRKIK